MVTSAEEMMALDQQWALANMGARPTWQHDPNDDHPSGCHYHIDYL